MYIHGADFPAVMNVVDDLNKVLRNMSVGAGSILAPLPDDDIGFAEAFKNWLRDAKPGKGTEMLGLSVAKLKKNRRVKVFCHQIMHQNGCLFKVWKHFFAFFAPHIYTCK